MLLTLVMAKISSSSSSSSIYQPYTNKNNTMMIKAKAAHGEEAHKETTGLIYYEPPQYR